MTVMATSEKIDAFERRSRAWAATALCVLVAAPVSYFFVDRPLATLAYENLRPQRKIFDALTHLIDPFPALAALVLVWAAVVVARRAPVGPVLEKLVRVSAGLCAAIVAKDQLKYAFGRTWPETWVLNNPSWFKDGAYGFTPFHGGPGWFSFPSGHTTIACAVAAGLWVLWPRGRPLYALGVALVAIGLVGADYHWLSDIIAGGALGAAFGVAAARIGNRA